ncbi:T-complex protein 11-like protein 1 [Gossypium australe]|uniref:T-complex protein 11-like protein 1 n=1 Tax=Gossypium australe TaxID=47621 RepID=A0A5B6UJT3_9ROSI|nr:T-complex protein 11-like protein 1 [Gossypium australe]
MMMETPESGRAVALEFPASETPSSSRVPRRIRKRLLAECKSPSTVEEIEAKLRHADLRRQVNGWGGLFLPELFLHFLQFYESLSSKARSKPRSPSRSSNEEDLGQRLEAKLQAAEQKRLSILAKAQMRLAKLDELRQAAKTGVEMRFEKEREKLGTKVQSRVQQAEANRMLILEAYSQRRATLRERSSQSLLRRMARESKYKELVRAAIHQKRAAAEKKRLGLLEAEKKKACARISQVKRVAKSISHQREIERRTMKDQLEDRMQRAKRQRAEYLRQRGRSHKSVQENYTRMYKQAELLSRKLARCWRWFIRQRKTTLNLAKAFDSLKINENSVKQMPFEQLALLIESVTTLQTVKALLDRIENRIKAARAIGATDHLSSLDNIVHLLKRVATPKRRTTPRTSMRSRETKRVVSGKEVVTTVSRYPVRVFLCAYMILGHPEAVLSGQGEREIALAKSAEAFVLEFELLVKIILEGPIQSPDEESDSTLSKPLTFRSQLAAFDKAWCSYLSSFVVWKVKDARSLEEDLVRAACQLELSMIQKCKLTPEGDNTALTHDMKAIQRQVMEDQKLLREKVQHLCGDAGIERMECALSETRTKFFQSEQGGSPTGSPITPSLSSSTDGSPSSLTARTDNGTDLTQMPNRVVRSLFKEDEDSTSSSKNSVSSVPSNSHLNTQLASSIEKQPISENELIVNEFLHEKRGFVDSISGIEEDQNGIKAKIRETMEKAFWDGIMESMSQDKPNYDRVIELVKEVRDEICEMAPKSWREEIINAIDLEILSQVLKSGNLDIDYLGRILGFALITLQKLSSPANGDEMKAANQRLLKELTEICEAKERPDHSPALAMIKGLRFVLEQIQDLKREISKARIRMMEPLLKGPAGLDYLQKAFQNRYGSPSDAGSSLPLTMRWLSSVWNCKDQEWGEHQNSVSTLKAQDSSSRDVHTPITLKTGGSYNSANASQMKFVNPSKVTDHEQPECKGDQVDMVVRLGLLKLVSGVSGLTSDSLPETFTLNLARLRGVQAEIQKIIVISTSILICRQIFSSEQVVASPTDMESIILICTERLLELLDHVEDVGIEGIVEVISGLSRVTDEDKVQTWKVMMGRMLAKSLQAGDVVFEKVWRAVYLAFRGVVFGGSGVYGKKLSEIALQQVGAGTGSGLLTERVVKAAEVLVIAATVSVNVHGPWYITLIGNM